MPDKDDDSTALGPGDGEKEPMVLEALVAEIDDDVGMTASMETPWEEKLQEPADEPRRDGGQYIRFFLEDTEIGVPLSSAQEVGRMPDVTPLPNLPTWILGISNIRGDIVSVVDLKRYLGWTPGGRKRDHRIIVVSNGQTRVGLRVDRVAGIFSLDRTGAEILPSPFKDEPEPELAFYVRGVVGFDEHSLYILDIEKLLSSSRMTEFTT